ncbi:MAG: magnesium-translocating P-type ATPase, partial [Proteobacteria bacterium]|nr:magnesium-translocating P-type ATPase [Pseudomonadota bacterium]
MPPGGEVLDCARLGAAEALARLGSGPGGLAEAEAGVRLAGDGPNTVAREGRRHPLLRLLQLFLAPLALLLLALSLVSALTGEPHSAVVIVLILVLSVLLSFVQEHRASRAAERLRAMVHTTATLLRDGAQREVPLERIVRGDVVHLSAGDLVPADLRLIAAKD